MIPDAEISEYFRAGGVYYDIKGETSFEAFKSLCDKVNLPSSILPVNLYEGLCAREAILSTAVGNGVAIPHSQQPLLKRAEDQRIFVCYLKTPVDMQALDSKKVHTLIVPLSSSVQSHLRIISFLAGLLKRADFRKALELKLEFSELYSLMRQF